MKRCQCGNNEYKATQLCVYDVVTYVNGDNELLEKQPYVSADSLTMECVSCEDPVGPYVCLRCGAVYESLDDIPDEKDAEREAAYLAARVSLVDGDIEKLKLFEKKDDALEFIRSESEEFLGRTVVSECPDEEWDDEVCEPELYRKNDGTVILSDSQGGYIYSWQVLAVAGDVKFNTMDLIKAIRIKTSCRGED